MAGLGQMKAQRAWRETHRWIGLVAGTVMALIGLTGGVTVFQREIDAWLNPALFTPGEGEAQHGAATALAAALALDRSGRVSVIRLPDPVWPVLTVNQTRRGAEGMERWMVHVDPVSGRVLGARDFEASFTQTIYDLHSTLLLRPWWGKELVGIIGLLALFSIGSGLYLWWPRQDGLRALLRLRRRPRQILYLDLHNLAGAWTAVLLLLVVGSGVWLSLPGLVRPVVNLATDTRDRPPSAPGRFAWPPPIGAAQAQAIAEAAFPGMVTGYLSPPTARRNAWQLGMRGAEEDPRLRSRALVWINPNDGAVMGRLGEGDGPLGARVEKDLAWFHSGALFGLGGRLLALLAGLALPGLWLTGLLLWLRKRRLRQRAPSRAAGVVA
jgi:uncharacterized iron-regulated membrane protein